MKIYTPQISWHDRQPILSVDIQNRLHSVNDSTTNQFYYRLATGGNDNHVNIWKISIQETNNENKRNNNGGKKESSIECLAELTQHQRAVNVVRFSPNLDDNLLASGDDDSLIYIWKYCCNNNEENNQETNQNQSNVGNMIESETISIEIWKTHKTLRGHNQDVSDLCWSRDGQYLVSGSVDNNVFVWDVQRGTKMHKLIKEHNGYVQGVTWDPLSKYIASLSADRQLIIINTKNGKTLHKIYKISNDDNNNCSTDNNKSTTTSSKLFHDQTLMTFFRRLTFSPNGELLFAPSGILEHDNDRLENVVHIFERKSFNRPTFYLPTDKFSVAVKCCPIVFELRMDEKINVFNIPYRIVFAVATADSILLYDSQQAIPFGYISNIHYLRLTDLSWSSDGRILIATSTDGFSSFIIFDDQELGTPYTGNLMNFDEIDCVNLNIKILNKINDNNNNSVNNNNPNNNNSPNSKTPSKNLTKQKCTTPKCSTPITEFFRKSPKINDNKNNQQLSNNNNNKPGRRIQLITIQKSLNNNQMDDELSATNVSSGIKRKQSNESTTDQC